MLKISKKASVTLSLTIAVTFAVLLILSVLSLLLIYSFPELREIFISPWYWTDKKIYIIPTLIELFIAFIADIKLIQILRNIKNEIVFETKNVESVRMISWCCFGEMLVFLLEAIYYHFTEGGSPAQKLAALILLVITFVCGFVGIVVRVVKNILEEATAIKNENDFTV